MVSFTNRPLVTALVTQLSDGMILTPKPSDRLAKRAGGLAASEVANSGSRLCVSFFVTKVAILVAALVAAVVVGSAASRPMSSAGSIALAGGGISVRSTSGQLTQLTTDFRDQFPVWSRDGKRIAFVRRGADVNRCALFVMNADGSNDRQVGSFETDCSRVSWGPADRQIAFGGGVAGRANNGLWVVNGDGSGLKQLVPIKRLLGGRETTTATAPAWSPSGRSIVFGWAGRSPGSHPWPRLVGMLATIRSDGSGLRILLKPRNPARGTLSSPAFSRDGKRLAFVHTNIDAAGRTELVVSRADGTRRYALLRLPFNPLGQGTSSWSPNARSLVFWRVCGQQTCVSTIPASGGKPHLLLRGTYLQPYWGPAGS